MEPYVLTTAAKILSTWVLGVLLVIAPPERIATRTESIDDVKARYTKTANELAQVIEERGSLFKGANAKYTTAATMLGIIKFESELAGDVAIGKRRGDHGKSWCYAQINIDGTHVIWGDEKMRSWTGEDLVTDWKKCFSVQHEILKYSLKACWNYKDGDILSGYTAGVCAENEKKARHRWNYAHWILRKFPVPTETAVD